MIEIAKLPENATATDVIDLVADAVFALVAEVNGPELTASQALVAFDRTFPLALVEFLGRLDAARPELGARIRAEYVAEEEQRRAARVLP